MAWDSTRPVPWRRLVRDWAIYAAVMAFVFVIFFRESTTPGTFVGLMASLPIYLAVGSVLAKFGYQRRTMGEMRAESAARTAARSAASSAAPTTTSRPKPPPTRRTGGGTPRRRR